MKKKKTLKGFCPNLALFRAGLAGQSFEGSKSACGMNLNLNISEEFSLHGLERLFV